MKKVIPSRTKDVAAYAPAERVKGPAKIAWGVMELSVFDGLCCANHSWKLGIAVFVIDFRTIGMVLEVVSSKSPNDGPEITAYVFFPFVDRLPCIYIYICFNRLGDLCPQWTVVPSYRVFPACWHRSTLPPEVFDPLTLISLMLQLLEPI